jgi:D-alanyl-D-alanine carboxypeptidase
VPPRSNAVRGRALASVALAAALAAIPLALPSSAAGVGPLPGCQLDDVRTVPRGYDDWAITQVDWNLTLGKAYRPPDLVSVQDGGVAGGGYVRAVAIDDLRAMARAAEDNGTPLVAWSPYRGYQQQVALFDEYRRGYGFRKATTFSARPGHSEHQLGLTIDFVAVGDTGLTSNWEATPTGAWMAANAWKFGWLMSYPKGKRQLTCYSYEPWHYRYVGRDLAEKIHDSGLTTREYLWANYTQVDGSCMAVPPASLETPGTPRSCPLGSPAPSPGASEPPPGPSAAPGTAPPSTSPGPNATAGPALGPVGLPEGVTGPLVAAAAVAVGILLLLVLRRPRAER